MFKKNSDFVYGQINCFFRMKLKSVILINSVPMSSVVLRDHVTVGSIENVIATGNLKILQSAY